MTVRYLDATINRNARKQEPEIGTNGSSETRQNQWVTGYGYGFGPQRSCGSGFWTVLEPNRTLYPVQTRTAGGLPGPVANTSSAAAEAGRWPRRGNTSSATVAGGETSNRHYGRRWEKRRAGKRADADTCRSLNCFPWKSATKR